MSDLIRSRPENLRVGARWLWMLGASACAAASLAVLQPTDDNNTVAAPTIRSSSVSTAERANSSGTGKSNDAMRIGLLTTQLQHAEAQWRPRKVPPLGDAALQAWSPPRAASAPSSIASGAQAGPPTFPYQWIGRMDLPSNDGSASSPAPAVVIAGPHGAWVLHRGDTLDGLWRIEQIGASELQMTYLPLNAPTALSMAPQ